MGKMSPAEGSHFRLRIDRCNNRLRKLFRRYGTHRFDIAVTTYRYRNYESAYLQFPNLLQFPGNFSYAYG